MDRFYRGFIAGTAAAIPLNAWSLFSYYNLKLTDRRLLDWAGMLVFGSMPKTALQVALALFMQLVYSGFRGILFAFLVPHIGSRGVVGKAVIFSVILSFAEEFIVVLFKVPNLAETSADSVISTLLGAVLWGVVLAVILRRLEPRAGEGLS